MTEPHKFWKNPITNPPKCGQTILALLDWGADPGFVIATVYVAKVRGKRRYGFSPAAGPGMPFRQHDAEKSFPCDDEVLGWREVEALVPPWP